VFYYNFIIPNRGRIRIMYFYFLRKGSAILVELFYMAQNSDSNMIRYYTKFSFFPILITIKLVVMGKKRIQGKLIKFLFYLQRTPAVA